MMNVNRTGKGVFISYSSRRAHAHTFGVATAMAFSAAIALFLGAPFCMAQRDLARLVPPGAPVIAGLHRVPNDQARDALWLATRNNTDDFSRLVALTDHDPDRRIAQVIVADWASSTERLGNHLLIAQGRFSLANVIPGEAGDIVETLKVGGVGVLAIEVIGALKPGRLWLAVPRTDIALFGTPSAVQAALERFRSGVPADPWLLARLQRAHYHGTAWSSVLLDMRSVKMPADIHAGNAFSSCLGQMREVGLGIELGKTVTIDLQMEAREASSGNISSGTTECVSEALFGRNTPAMRVVYGGDRQPDVHVSMGHMEYDAWLDSFRKSRMQEVLEAMISSAGPGESTAE